MMRIRTLALCRRIVVLAAILAASAPAWAAPPVISLDGDYINGGFSDFSHIRQGKTMTFVVSVTDADGDTATISASNLPGGASFVDNSNNTGLLTWKPSSGQKGAFEVFFTANDGVSQVSDSEVFLVTAYPLSHGYYRFPYADGTVVRISNDHDTHTPVIKYDMRGIPEFFLLDPEGDTIPGQYQIHSGAYGGIWDIEDDNSECCSNSCSSCNNHVWLRHFNGEFTKYTHFEQGTVEGAAWAGLSINDTIATDTYLGEEGDVGHTSGGVSSYNRPQTGCSAGGTADTTRPCGIHLHFECRVDSTGSELRIPMICGIPGNILYGGDTITAAACPSACVQDTFVIPMATEDTSDIVVVQANERITTEFAGFYTVTGTASVNFNAGTSITLAPGFSAKRHSYFHAWIGPCNSPPGGPRRGLRESPEETVTEEYSRDE